MNKTYKNEQGRSMVEMLGVLAIIGVLSVAGIAGYSMAMRNYRANEIVNAASMFYVLAKAQNQGNGPNANIAYADVGGTNPSGATLAYTNNAFTITFDDPDDCTVALNKLGDKATGTCPTLTVNFGENATLEDNSTSVVDLSGMTRSECNSGGYHWMDADASCSAFEGCYHYPSEAKDACESVDYCGSIYNDSYCGYGG